MNELFIYVNILLDVIRLSLASEQTIFELYHIDTRALGRSTETKPFLKCKGHFALSTSQLFINLLAFYMLVLALLETCIEQGILLCNIWFLF